MGKASYTHTERAIPQWLRERVQQRFDEALERLDFDKAALWAWLIEQMQELEAEANTESE